MDVVLDGDRNARQRQRLARRDAAVDLDGGLDRVLVRDVEERAVAFAAPPGPHERGPGDVPRAHLPGRDGGGEAVRRSVEETGEVPGHPFLETTRGTTKCPRALSGAFAAT